MRGPPVEASGLDLGSESRPSRLRLAALRLATVGFGVLLALGLAEIALAVLLPPPPRFLHPQPRHVPHEELGWVLRPDQSSYTIDAPVRTNRLGFRSDEIAADGRGLVICLGDSQTFGNGVRQEATYPARLEALLGPRGFRVLNAGVQAYDTTQELRLLERLAPELRPEVVTIGFYINDVHEVLRSNRAEIMDVGGQAKRRGLKRLTPYRLIYALKRIRVFTFARDRMRLLTTEDVYSPILEGDTPPGLERGWHTIERELRSAHALSAELGFRLIVFPIPTQMEFRGDYPREQYRSRLLHLAETLGIEHFDPTPGLKAAGATVESHFVPWDGHIGPATHAYIAERLAAAIAAGPDLRGADT